MSALTHRVAVAAYILRNDKMLLLKRVAEPQTFAPPGGRLEIGEDPMLGILREVNEETGLSPEIVGVAHTWFGQISADAEPLLCINYIATSYSGEPRLSYEHTEFLWVTRLEIVMGEARTQNEQGHGYRAESLLDAFDKYEAWTQIAKR